MGKFTLLLLPSRYKQMLHRDLTRPGQYPIPFAIKDAISQELDHLEQEGIVTPVTHSKWAAPIVPVSKKGGNFRVCGDYKVSVNQALVQEEYPLPAPEE